MDARSLQSLLTRQWMLFALGVALLFATAALLLLFMLEDSFIDRRLEAAARSVSDAAPGLSRLAPEFAVYPVEAAPLDIHARLPFADVGEPFEMRRADRRYIHAVVGERPDGERFVVVYDVTDELTVSPRLGAGFTLVLALTSATLLAAYVLVRTFVGGVTRHAERLAENVRRSPDPSQLRQLAREQVVLEFQHLLLLHADIWSAQLQAVENERQTLAYLGHELRTPLQSAKTSIALLAEHRDDEAAFDRLTRALSRLTRASCSALWLATDRAPDLSTAAPLLPTIRMLAAELQPIAALAEQTIEVSVPRELVFQGPTEIVEIILANILLNAIQHGAPGPISVHGAPTELIVTNLRRDTQPPSGFGFGLEIVQRLARRIGWSVEVVQSANSMRATIQLPSTPPSPT